MKYTLFKTFLCMLLFLAPKIYAAQRCECRLEIESPSYLQVTPDNNIGEECSGVINKIKMNKCQESCLKRYRNTDGTLKADAIPKAHYSEIHNNLMKTYTTALYYFNNEYASYEPSFHEVLCTPPTKMISLTLVSRCPTLENGGWNRKDQLFTSGFCHLVEFEKP